MMQQPQVAESIKDLLDEFLDGTEASLREASVDVANLAAQAAAQSAALVGLPGYQRAVQANMEIAIGRGLLRGVQEADELDERLWGILYGAVSIAARALAGV